MMTISIMVMHLVELMSLQDEIGEMHRQRINAKTLSNTTAFRVNKNRKLHSILQFYPGILVPADSGEIERLDLNNPQADSLDERMLALVKERTGIDPATGGTGGGIVNQKRGIYSSQQAFAYFSSKITGLGCECPTCVQRIQEQVLSLQKCMLISELVKNFVSSEMICRFFENGI